MKGKMFSGFSVACSWALGATVCYLHERVLGTFGYDISQTQNHLCFQVSPGPCQNPFALNPVPNIVLQGLTGG